MLPLRSAAFRQRSPAPAAPASLSATFLDDLWAYRHAIFAVLTTVILMGAYTCAKVYARSVLSCARVMTPADAEAMLPRPDPSRVEPGRGALTHIQ